MTDESEIRLPFYRSFTTFWIAFSGLCTQVVFLFMGTGKR